MNHEQLQRKQLTMATRANIKIVKHYKENVYDEAHLYRHCDGYPEGLGTELFKFFRTLDLYRCSEYNFNRTVKAIVDEFGCEEVDAISNDIDYYYEIDISKKPAIIKTYKMSDTSECGRSMVEINPKYDVMLLGEEQKHDFAADDNKNTLYDDFVDSELAQTLKSKGYPQSREYAIAMYNEDGIFCSLCTSSGDYYDIGDFDENDCVAPTLQSVRKWLNEYHNIFISISVAFVGSENKKRYLWLPCVLCADHIEYPTMEEIEADSEKDAVNAAIRYCVKYLI